jgi:hypothetical protein
MQLKHMSEPTNPKDKTHKQKNHPKNFVLQWVNVCHNLRHIFDVVGAKKINNTFKYHQK